MKNILFVFIISFIISKKDNVQKTLTNLRKQIQIKWII